jgi:hypothetical protein
LRHGETQQRRAHFLQGLLEVGGGHDHTLSAEKRAIKPDQSGQSHLNIDTQRRGAEDAERTQRGRRENQILACILLFSALPLRLCGRF